MHSTRVPTLKKYTHILIYTTVYLSRSKLVSNINCPKSGVVRISETRFNMVQNSIWSVFCASLGPQLTTYLICSFDFFLGGFCKVFEAHFFSFIFRLLSVTVGLLAFFIIVLFITIVAPELFLLFAKQFAFFLGSEIRLAILLSSLEPSS